MNIACEECFGVVAVVQRTMGRVFCSVSCANKFVDRRNERMEAFLPVPSARLIAAAPDLLEACKAAIAAMELHGADGQEFFDARNMMLEAIKKAEKR